MPTYVYKNCGHIGDNETFELFNIPIEDRDKLTCHTCGETFQRKWIFEGSVWAPTAGGMR